MPKNHSPMGNKGPLDAANFARLKAELDQFAARKAARQRRCYSTLRQHSKPSNHWKAGELFSQLPPEIRPLAREKFEAYKLKHKDKLDSLTGMAKVRYIGSLAGAAAAHAKHPNGLGHNPDMRRMKRMAVRANTLRTRLGMRQAKPSWGRGPEQYRGKRLHEVIEMQVAELQRDQGQQPVAEVGSTDMSGV